MADLPKLPGIPSINPVQDQTLSTILRSIKENIEILGSAVSGRPMPNGLVIDAGFNNAIAAGSSTTAATSSNYDPFTDYTPPPAPTGFSAQGAFSNIILEWDDPTYQNHSYTEVWRATSDAIGSAVLIGFAPGSVFADVLGNNTTYYYWVRFVSKANVTGPYNNSSGTPAHTSLDPEYALQVLSGSLTTGQLNTELNTRIDLVDAPASTVNSVNARIAVVQGQVSTLLQTPIYDNTKSYIVNEQVQYNGGLYICTAPTTGNLPTNTAYWDKIGDYTSLGDAVAAHTIQIAQLNTDLGTEVTERSVLASQLRGGYTGTDLNAVTSGLVYQERVARTSAIGAVASDLTVLAATVGTKTRVYSQTTAPTGASTGDLWIDTTFTYTNGYWDGDYSIKSNHMYRWNGSAWLEAIDYGFYDTLAAITIERNARVSADEAFTSQINSLVTQTNNNASAITLEQTTRANADSALAANITTLFSTTASTNAALQIEQTTRANADSALSSSITTLQSTVAGNTTSIQQNTSTINGIQGIYSVKISNNGTLSGFGLMSTLTSGGAVTSQFLISANQFAVIAPGATFGTPSSVPLAVLTTAQTINGVSFNPGVYIDGGSIVTASIKTAAIGDLAVDSAKIANGAIVNAKIADASITNAKIQDASISTAKIQNAAIGSAQIANASITDAKISDLNASKITAGTINADRIAAASITAAKIDSRNLTIKDANGNVLFGAGTSLSWSLVTGTGRPADYADVTANNTAAGIANQGAFATLSQITGSNISTYIAAAAIGQAYIADASISSAKIQNAAINNAKIGDAQVDTIKIGANAVSSSIFLQNSGSITFTPDNGAQVLVLLTLKSNNQTVQVGGYRSIFSMTIYKNGAGYLGIIPACGWYAYFGGQLNYSQSAVADCTYSFIDYGAGVPVTYSASVNTSASFNWAVFILKR